MAWLTRVETSLIFSPGWIVGAVDGGMGGFVGSDCEDSVGLWG